MIEVGEYVRINKGNIGKVIGIFKGHCAAKYHIQFQGGVRVKRQYLSKKTIIKHSKNIIDLIEVGDIVEVELSEEFVERKDKIVFTRIGDVYTKELLQRDVDNGIIVKIKTILTHEQYNQNCYTVKGKEK